jgi:hypothetical protein
MERDGIRDHCERLAAVLVEGALGEHLSGIDLEPRWQRQLETVARYMIQRDE